MFLSFWQARTKRARNQQRSPSHRFRPTLEGLECRVVPYALSGSQWASTAVTASFMPDGTITAGGLPSNLFAKLDAEAPTAVWQGEFARALQTWASVSPLNFHFVPDSGDSSGTQGSVQGDSRFGDIRLGAYVRSDAFIAYAFYPGGDTLGGDVSLNSAVTFHVGADPDLYSVLLHESGHALGLGHSSLTSAVMFGSLTGVYTGLSPDDIAGIQAIYGARQHDVYDATASNDSLGSATALSLSSGGVNFQADLTSQADVDYYQVVASGSSLTVSVDARNLSLLAPQVLVYDTAGNLRGAASADYGKEATLNLTGLNAGETYYLVADGATADVFGMGAYQLSAQFGGVVPQPSQPTLSINSVAQAEGDSGTTAFNYTVTLSAPSTSTVTVQYATADGTATAGNDYTASSGTLSFAPGETQKTITIAVQGDTVVEADETFSVRLSAPTNATLGTSEGQGTIQNDDTQPDVIGPDRFEINDTVMTATNFGTTNGLSESNLTLHTTTDIDYYSFTPRRKGTFQVTVTVPQGSGTVNLMVLDAQQNVLGSSQSLFGSVSLTLNMTSGTPYYVKVNSATGDMLAYGLDVTKSGGSGKTGNGKSGGGKGGKGGGALALEEERGDGLLVLALPPSQAPAFASAAEPLWGGYRNREGVAPPEVFVSINAEQPTLELPPTAAPSPSTSPDPSPDPGLDLNQYLDVWVNGDLNPFPTG
jgi:hypothetical protein